METELIIAIVTSGVAAAGSITCALIASGSSRKQDRNAKDAKDYRERRERVDRAKWKVLLATQEGVTVLLHQAKGEKLNGNVEAALGKIAEAEAELTEVQINGLIEGKE